MPPIKRIARSVALFLLTISLTACAGEPRVKVTRVDQAVLPPTNLVQTFSRPPDQPYTVIAHLQIQGTVGEDRAQLIAALLKKAGSIGANGLWVTGEQTHLLLQNGPVAYNPAGGYYAPQAPQPRLEIKAEALHIQK